MIETYSRRNPLLSFHNMIMSVFMKRQYVIHQNVINRKERVELRPFKK